MPEPHCNLCAWVLEHETEIRNGGAELDGIVVTATTEVVCYRWTVSLLVITLNGETPHRFSDQNTGGGIPTLVSGLLGWWGFPWGPIHTLSSITRNIGGGIRSTVASLVAEQKWGVKVLDDAAGTSHERALLEFTPEAVQEIERRRTGGRFENDIAVRLLPDDRDHRTCLLQFDYPVSDGNQWLFRSEGLTVVIDKTDTDFFDRQNIHFDGYEFLVFETKS